MRSEEPRAVRLADYRAPDFLIDTVHLDVNLAGPETLVVSRLRLRPNPAGRAGVPLVLDGDALRLSGTPLLDGAELDAASYAATPTAFTLHEPPADAFELTLTTKLDPAANTQLMGLYRSGSAYCTQCEAEGFRRITYFLDRPDVLSVYTVRIEADRAEAPVLLANGNPVESGDLDGNRHFAVWHDPFPKPCYLFALVGGDLAVIKDDFRTASGRHVDLAIYVEHGKEERAAYAMDALKRSMRWDEQAFGREYDLDVFNIVAVSDFNMGAMENKGLNVFNDKYVLASSETATDADYAGIESVIAHEYFHNWTGNRITCRDWFQLCLKEGLTVFRDQEFTQDMRSRPVERISDVRGLRSVQFPEDAGPFAHPVRPDTYREINNFYTATVYEKGAEVIRMLKTLIGVDAFRRGMDLYFARHDGEAATIEQFIACFAEASGHDLKQFLLWYSQAGTPEVIVTEHWDASSGTYALDIRQHIPATPGQTDKKPMVIPLAFGLLGSDGNDVDLGSDGRVKREGLIVLTSGEHRFEFRGLKERPVPSLNRNFSSPIQLKIDLSDNDLLFAARHDGDQFNCWQAMQSAMTRLLVTSAKEIREGGKPLGEPRIAEAIASVLNANDRDDAFAAQFSILPTETDLTREIGTNVDPDAIYAARRGLKEAISAQIQPSLLACYSGLADQGSYTPDAKSAGRRSLRGVALDLLVVGGGDEAIALAERQYADATNMTDRMSALASLSQVDHPVRERAFSDFAERFANEPLVLDKWFALQAAIPERGTLDRVRGLMNHPAFSMGNPNRIRSLVGGFASGNPTQFNRPDGAGYEFLADVVLELDPKNPQVAARLLGAFRSWKTLENGRRALAEQALRRINAVSPLSADVSDLVTRALA
ncbi:aminopeptidase N [Flaviflagellibacter deserti]|uniref:Aminopeptidase N n=1 Tax=Flaviflagellibacter deserti TaxID=2267266 RepID=A0ABV9Z141_9HYPH